MKNIDKEAFIEIQNIVLEHDYRELSLLASIMNNLYIKESAEMILENIDKGKIIISTGFFEIIPKVYDEMDINIWSSLGKSAWKSSNDKEKLFLIFCKAFVVGNNT